MNSNNIGNTFRRIFLLISAVITAAVVLFAGSGGKTASCVSAAAAGLPDAYVRFSELTEPDYSVSTSCTAQITDGVMMITAGKPGGSGKVKGTPYVEFPLIDTGLKVLRYPFVAIRIKSSMRSEGGRVTLNAGFGKTAINGDFTYYSTDDWQTVVVDMSDAIASIKNEADRKGTYQGTVKLMPFGSSAGKSNNGDTAFVESIAFFKTAESAKSFAGLGSSGDNMNDGKWLSGQFEKPGASYRMMKLLYNFDGNYKNVVDKLYNAYGYGGVTTNVTFNAQYLKSDREFSLLDQAFSYCLEDGMTQLWIYDEYQWPSGSAYGMVAEGNPEYEPYGIAMLEESGSGRKIYELPSDYAVIKYATLTSDGKTEPVKFTDRTVDIDRTGKWDLRVWATFDAWIEKETLSPWQKGRPYVNIMSRDAIAKFITLTHEAYKAKLTGSFGSVEAFFTDEPSLFVSNMTNSIHAGGNIPVYLMPWEDSLPDEFMKMHGYSLLEHLGSLYGGDSEEDRVVRVNFQQTVAKLVSENYFGQIAQWCASNGTKGSGHLLLEEKLAYHVVLYGDFMKCMNRTGYAGCDLLQVSPQQLMNSNTYVGSFAAIKLASSSARNMNMSHVMVEFNPEAIADKYFQEDPFGTSFAGAVITRMYGADTFVMLNPQESYNTAQARRLNDCVGRLNVLLENASMNSGIGVYYPIATVQGMVKADTVYDGDVLTVSEGYNEICRDMLKNGFDYNYIDDESILNGTVKDGKLECGRTSYSVIVMAYANAMDPAVADKLTEFENAGGRLIWVDTLPEYSTVKGKTAELLSKTDKYRSGIVSVRGEGGSIDNLLTALSASLSYGYSISADSNVLTSPYARDGRQLIVAVNSGSSDKRVKLTFEDGGGFDVYDLYSGAVSEGKSGDEIIINGYRAVVLVHEGTSEPVAQPTEKPAENTSGGFPAVPVIAGAAAAAAGGVALAVAISKKKRSGGKK